jgi:hypothetical protein
MIPVGVRRVVRDTLTSPNMVVNARLALPAGRYLIV